MFLILISDDGKCSWKLYVKLLVNNIVTFVTFVEDILFMNGSDWQWEN